MAPSSHFPPSFSESVVSGSADGSRRAPTKTHRSNVVVGHQGVCTKPREVGCAGSTGKWLFPGRPQDSHQSTLPSKLWPFTKTALSWAQNNFMAVDISREGWNLQWYLVSLNTYHWLLFSCHRFRRMRLPNSTVLSG